VSTSRPAWAAVGALLVALCLAACGSSGSTTSGNANAGAGATQPGGGRRGFLRDPKVVACLKKAGVTVPSRPRGGNGGPPGGQNGQPPSGQTGRPPSGQGQPNRGPDSAQFQKLREALQKCGVTFQGRPPNGQPPQGGEGTTSTSAS
jgi:hypothetical protein